MYFKFNINNVIIQHKFGNSEYKFLGRNILNQNFSSLSTIFANVRSCYTHVSKSAIAYWQNRLLKPGGYNFFCFFSQQGKNSLCSIVIILDEVSWKIKNINVSSDLQNQRGENYAIYTNFMLRIFMGVHIFIVTNCRISIIRVRCNIFLSSFGCSFFICLIFQAVNCF